MIVRLLLALLLASFAVPATAAGPACHEQPMAAMVHHGAPETPAPAHVCIGCVPLADWLGARIAPRLVPAARPVDAPIVRLDLGGAVAPALPPPRIA